MPAKPKTPPPPEPQTIGTGIAQALHRLQSLHACSDAEVEAAKVALADKERPGKLIRYGFPERAVRNLPTMHGPGLDAALLLKDRFCKPGVILFLIGDRGPGKTQIATFLASERMKDGKKAGTYIKALDMWSKIRATWRAGSDKTEEDVLMGYKKADFLTIDEAQERGDTETDRQWCDRMLAHIIDHRYDAMLDTLLIANLDLAKYESSVPASIRSRVAECGGVKLCDWPSYRNPTPAA